MDGEPLESPAWPADRYTAALWQLRTPIGKDVLCGQASITVGSASKLKWRCLSDGEHYFVIDVAERNPPCCLYVEMSVATFADEPSSPDQAGASPDEG
ncbi:MAG: hypothetical protein ABIQ70_14710 [Dokdonella sp.]